MWRYRLSGIIHGNKAVLRVLLFRRWMGTSNENTAFVMPRNHSVTYIIRCFRTWAKKTSNATMLLNDSQERTVV